MSTIDKRLAGGTRGLRSGARACVRAQGAARAPPARIVLSVRLGTDAWAGGGGSPGRENHRQPVLGPVSAD